ncbi:ABC transporter permease [Parafrankia sp. EUN1f]|uniref:ABC transporter permease n=1 Tax=Parafrankia sp. EUN1f TaxID=102897 RepID=UPI0001C45A74|nr:ABC transporter permease [Parafrankia sp. EUN1f]EFC82766.1 binding-protein-dependent transport systems inner membrane component [Parafrankia sp. EUN1f]
MSTVRGEPPLLEAPPAVDAHPPTAATAAALGAAAPGQAGPLHRLGTFARRRPGLVLAILWLLLLVVAAVLPAAFTSRDPLATDTAHRLLSPSWSHPFGTDQLGRDQFARVVHGTSRTLPTALLATAIGLGTGAALGLLAGFLRGWVDVVVMRLVDVLLSIPGLLLALTLIAVLGKGGTVQVAVAIGVAAVAETSRVTRAEVFRVRESLYVQAAHAGGARRSRVLLRHVLPNAMGPVWALTTLLFGGAVLGVATLSFLGFGIQPPTPEWGSLVSTGRDHLQRGWWMSILPGVVVAATVLAANRLSREFSDDLGGGR